MKRSICLHLAWSSLLVATSAFGGDELFSDIRVESVYGPASTPAGAAGGTVPSPLEPTEKVVSPNVGGPDAVVPIAGPASLSEALRNGGFDPKEVTSQYLSVQVDAGDEARTAFATVSEDRKRVQFVLPLSKLAKGATLSADRLTALMEANRADRAERFAFSARLGRIELHRSLENRDLTGARLREVLETMAAVAEETAPLWTLDQEAAAGSDSAGTEPEAGKSAVRETAGGIAAGTLVGSWTASRSKTQAFALRLDADGKFALVTVDGARNATSTGTFVLTDGRLALNDSKGGRLAGEVALRSADEFQFTPDGPSASPLRFERAK